MSGGGGNGGIFQLFLFFSLINSRIYDDFPAQLGKKLLKFSQKSRSD
jgi:hypothetical protein